MKRFLLYFLLCFMPLPYAECLAPTKTDIRIQQLVVTEDQTVYFGAYSIELPRTKKIIFSRDVMIFLYAKSENTHTHKYIALQAVDNPIEDGSYEIKDTFLTAFGISKEKEDTLDVIKDVRTGLGICNGKYIQYHVDNMSQTIIRYDANILDKNNAYILILNKNHQLVDMLVFSDLADNSIVKILATLREK